MKKHLFGLALFSFIFGATIFIYSMLNISSFEEVASPNYSPTYSKPTSCWKMKRDSNKANPKSPIVRQAIFNSQTKQLKWELDTPGVNTPIVLKFFIKDQKGARYINSRLVPVEAYQNGFVNATSFYELNDLDSYENLYVIAEPLSFRDQQYENFSMKFDADKATPVLIF